MFQRARRTHRSRERGNRVSRGTRFAFEYLRYGKRVVIGRSVRFRLQAENRFGASGIRFVFQACGVGLDAVDRKGNEIEAVEYRIPIESVRIGFQVFREKREFEHVSFAVRNGRKKTRFPGFVADVRIQFGFRGFGRLKIGNAGRANFIGKEQTKYRKRGNGQSDGYRFW